MRMARRSAEAVLAACLVAGAVGVAAPPARAATCQSVPASTPGTDVRLAGQDHRVPGISNIRVCAESPTAPVLVVDTAGHGTCLSPCLSILLDGNALDGGAVTLSYARDGVMQTSTTDLPGVPGPGDECLLSVGSPDAPYPDCFNAIGPDLGDPLGDTGDDVDAAVATVWDLAGDVGVAANQAIDTAEAVVADAQADAVALANQVLAEVDETLDPVEALAQNLLRIADDPCGSMPPQYDEWGNETQFCSDPGGWTYMTLQRACENNPRCAAEPDEVAELVTDVYCSVTQEPWCSF